MNNMIEILRQMQDQIGKMADELEKELKKGATTKTNAAETNVKSTATYGDLTFRVSDILREIGVPSHIKGYRYLRTAIIRAVEKPEVIENVTKVLYPDIAKSYDTT